MPSVSIISPDEIYRKARLQILLLVVALVGVVTLYLYLHFLIPAQVGSAEESGWVMIDDWGRASLMAPDEIDYYVGKERAVPLLAILNERSKRADTLRSRWLENLARFEQNFGGALGARRRVLARPDDRSVALLREISRTLSPSTLGGGGAGVINAMVEDADLAHELKADQRATLAQLRPPARYAFFWQSPEEVLIEVIFWALFGALTALLFHSAHYLSDKTEERFDPKEAWVSLPQVVYTPVIAVVLILALWAGLIEIGDPESRAWRLPLLAFLLGFSARKSAELVYDISLFVLDRAKKALGRSDQERAQAAQAHLAAYQVYAPINSLGGLADELRREARQELLRRLG